MHGFRKRGRDLQMSSNEIAIKIEGLGKCYEIYDQPGDRLKQFLFPRLRKLFGLSPKQYFREFWALRDISFEVKRGETVGIIGRNGSGKSTLLQIICGTLTPTTGSVQTNGRIAALLELGSGFNPEFTGRENVYLNASVLGLTKEETDARFDDIVAFADIGEFIDQPTKTYSSGMMVRLAFAVIAHVDADILVIDEALAVGDAFFTQKCMRFLRNFMIRNTILFVSHDPTSITSLCSRACWLDQGNLELQGEPKFIVESYFDAFIEAQNQSNSNVEKKQDEQLKQSQQKSLKLSKKGLTVEPDYRLAKLNDSNLRNDLRIFSFLETSGSVGIGGVEVQSICFLSEDESHLYVVNGGEYVKLVLNIKLLTTLDSPIVGFSVKDRLGQILFGENTYLSFENRSLECKSGDILCASFSFLMPILPAGDYSISVAVANGTQADHVQHYWAHDALIIRSISSSVSTGLIGVPMSEISLSKLTAVRGI